MADNKRLETVVRTARNLIGIPYAPHTHPHRKLYPQDGLSCFAFVGYVLESAGIRLPRGTFHVRDLFGAEIGQVVAAIEELEAGDILMFRSKKTRLRPGWPSHAAIYAGDGRLVHSSYSARGVEEWTLERALQRYNLLGARRLL